MCRQKDHVLRLHSPHPFIVRQENGRLLRRLNQADTGTSVLVTIGTGLIIKASPFYRRTCARYRKQRSIMGSYKDLTAAAALLSPSKKQRE